MLIILKILWQGSTLKNNFDHSESVYNIKVAKIMLVIVSHFLTLTFNNFSFLRPDRSGISADSIKT